MPRPAIIPLRLAAGLACLAACLLGQVESARIIGNVTDQSGAVMPGVAVTITNVDTNLSYQTETNSAGRYESVPLRIGPYRVAAEQAGFRRVLRDGIILQIQETAEINLVLEVGVVAEAVSVTADAPLLVATEATQGQVIDNQKIVDLPLNGRDYIQLALLSSGAVQPHPGSRFGGFSAGGVRAGQNNYILDGIDNNNMQNAAQGRQAETVKPSIDAIQEFKVSTNGFSAEYGRAAGAVVNVSIKSGTNDLHGTAYEFLRNEKLDAKNFFDSPTAPRPPFKRNQFGFSLGGPIVRNKTFAFGDYEGSRVRESRTVTSTIPTPALLQGNFSSLLPRTGIYDPASYDSNTGQRQRFPDNIIPASRFDPIGAELASYYPATNLPGLRRNFLYNPADSEDLNRWDTRIDHNLGPNDTLFGRYSWQRLFAPASPNLPPPAFGGGANASDFGHNGRNVALGWNHIFTPTLIMSTKAGWNKIFTRREPSLEDNRNVNSELGLKGVNTVIPGMAQFSMAGFSSLGIGPFNPNHIGSRNWQVNSDITWIRDKHSLKFGFNFQRLWRFLFNPRQSIGVFTFDGGYTRNTETVREGSSPADLLLGTASAAQVSNTATMDERAPYYDLYIQDQWRATDKLTLNLGLRYELHMPWEDINQHKLNVDFSDLANPTLILAQATGSRFDRTLVRNDGNNFGPRFGFAYRATDKTVVRGGYGVYYGNVVFQGVLALNPPFHYRANISTDRINPTIRLVDGLEPGLATPANARNIAISTQEIAGHMPYAQQWNFSIQNQLPADMLWEIGYFANTLHKEARRTQGNWALPGPGNVNRRRRYTSIFVPGDDVVIGPLAGWGVLERSANANYHSFQTKVEKRLSHGLSFLTSYIWSKAINDGRGAADSGGNGSLAPQNPRDLRAERGLADEHIAHRFVASYVYELPFGRGKKHMANAPAFVNGVLGGWVLAGIATATSGRMVNLTVRGNPSNSGDPNRPNVLRDWRLGADRRSLDEWFDTAAFEPNARFAYGNAGRNLIESPGQVNFDLSVYKNFAITEGTRVQFRFEAFNSFNTPAFGVPNVQAGNNNFGLISSAGRPRNLQFGLKFIF